MTYKFKDITVLIVDSQPQMIDMIRGALRLFGVPVNGLYSFSEGRMVLIKSKPFMSTSCQSTISRSGLVS